MAFTVTTQTIADRRAKLRQVQQLVNELTQINEAAYRISVQLIAQGISTAEVKITVDKILAAGGSPFPAAGDGHDVAECTGDTTSDRIINILSSQTDGIGWKHA